MLRSALNVIGLTACLAIACGDDEGTSGLSGGHGSSATASSSSSSSGDSSSGSHGSDSGSDSDSDSGASSSSSSTGHGSTTSDTNPTSSTGSTGSTGSSTTSQPADCNNGVLDPGEQCDGGNLGGFDCAGLGYEGGVLSCDPVMCILDTSMCEMGGDSTGSTGG